MKNQSDSDFDLLFWIVVAILLLELLSLYMSAAKAADIELGAGFNSYMKQTDGVYYQRWLPYEMDDQSTALSIGVSQEYRGIRYRAEFLQLGSMFVNGIVTSDGTYNPHYVNHCDPCNFVSFIARGSDSGVVLSASRPAPVMGVPFYVEAGAFVHQTKLQVNISELDGTPRGEFARQPQITVGPVLGFGVRYSGVDIGVRYYYLDDSSEGDAVTPMAQGATTLMFKAYF